MSPFQLKSEPFKHLQKISFRIYTNKRFERLWSRHTNKPMSFLLEAGAFKSASLRTEKKLEAKDVLPNVNRTQAERTKNAVFVPGDLYLWRSTVTFKLSERGTKHIFRVNLAQIRSAVPIPRYFIHKQKGPQTDCAKNRTFRSSLRAVKKATA